MDQILPTILISYYFSKNSGLLLCSLLWTKTGNVAPTVDFRTIRNPWASYRKQFRYAISLLRTNFLFSALLIFFGRLRRLEGFPLFDTPSVLGIFRIFSRLPPFPPLFPFFRSFFFPFPSFRHLFFLLSPFFLFLCLLSPFFFPDFAFPPFPPKPSEPS